MEETTKTCTKCGIEKKLSEFNKQKKYRFGVKSRCKNCQNAYARKYRKIHKEKIRLSAKEYRLEHKEELKTYAKKYRQDNHEEILIYQANYRKFYPEQVKSAQKKYVESHREKYKTIFKRHYKKKRTNNSFKLTNTIRTGIGSSLKGNKSGRHWESLVSFTLDDLKYHLERLFTKGMSWENYGKNGWEIDHKIPISAFNFSRPEHTDFKRCWALDNLQPMWARANIIKHNKLSIPFQPSLRL